MKRFFLVVPIKGVFKQFLFISSDPEQGWQGYGEAKAAGNNAVLH